MDVFLRPVEDEVKELWDDEVQTRDAAMNSIFKPCPSCNEDTHSCRVIGKTAYLVKGFRLASGFGSNFCKKVIDNDGNNVGLKSYDYHILMQRLLPDMENAEIHFNTQCILHDDLQSSCLLNSSSSSAQIINCESVQVSCSENYLSNTNIIVRPCLGGILEIIVISIHLSLSRVLEVLLQQGLSVEGCYSAKVNGRLIHTIKSEVDDMSKYIDPSELQQNLYVMFSTTSE
ncbi:uncharacterized protein LOC133779506 [Humulus lupulus]|uniref:uncharacterized protein LOC133779506 n=1 Tax=Humulus lupulus TaxID=3486 RepID=UPI002B408167|nr:uncharacterized protein LOC133779506 [Humulus lupulus]